MLQILAINLEKLHCFYVFLAVYWDFIIFMSDVFGKGFFSSVLLFFLLWVGCMISAKFFMADSAISTDTPLLSGKIKTILVMSTKWLH